MNIEVYTICYNEELFLPFFLNHYTDHLGVTKIVVYDNGSTDNSVAICKSFDKCEVEIRTFPIDTEGQIRDDVYLEIKNNCWKDSTADWVIVCDIDELLYVVDKQMLSDEIFQFKYPIIKALGYEMVSNHLPTYKEPITTQITEGVQLSQHCKCVLFRPTIQYINYMHGCHMCTPDGNVFISMGEIKLLHYKYLSLDYLTEVYRSRAKRLSEFNKTLNLGFHYTWDQQKIEKEYNNIWNNKQQVI